MNEEKTTTTTTKKCVLKLRCVGLFSYLEIKQKNRKKGINSDGEKREKQVSRVSLCIWAQKIGCETFFLGVTDLE